ncbi:MAG: ABC transporter substrate-binding protein [Alphaproteobacteria bacterium]|nr:ABC transporter substrate-binding protein [Alphaproteobacteria bacterium]
MPSLRTHCIVAILAGLIAAPTLAQDKPIRVLVGYPAGGTSDIVPRLIAERVKDRLGQTMVVENRVGAAGQIAAQQVKAAPADGSVLLFTPFAATVIAKFTYPKLAYDPDKDFVPVSFAGHTPIALAVGPQLGVGSLRDFSGWAKANAAKASYGSPAAGSAPHFLGLLFAREAGIELVHAAYRGSPPAVNDTAAGHIAATVTVLSDLLAPHKAGRIKVLAVASEGRSALAPDLPTFRELGYGNVVGTTIYGYHAPAGTPAAVVARLSEAINAAVRAPDLASRFADMGFDPVGDGAEAYGRLLAAESAKWGPIIKASGFTASD